MRETSVIYWRIFYTLLEPHHTVNTLRHSCEQQINIGICVDKKRMNIAIVICFTNQYYILNGLVLVCLSSELNKELLRIEYKFIIHILFSPVLVKYLLILLRNESLKLILQFVYINKKIFFILPATRCNCQHFRDTIIDNIRATCCKMQLAGKIADCTA